MCGRFVSTSPPERIATYFGADIDVEDLGAKYNVAPTDDIYAVVAKPAVDPRPGERTARALEAFHWGLLPSWAKDRKMAARMINARAETLAEKPAFKAVFRKHRCIIPMDGFYEWKAGAEGGPVGARGKPLKQPYFVHRADGEPLAVAGLWSAWRDRTAGRDAPWLHTASVITTTANQTMSAIHDRMPVILPKSMWDLWLDPANDNIAVLSQLLAPAPDDLLVMHPVSTEVNNVRNEGAHLIAPVPGGS